MIAIFNNHVNVVQYLVENGANVDAQSQVLEVLSFLIGITINVCLEYIEWLHGIDVCIQFRAF